MKHVGLWSSALLIFGMIVLSGCPLLTRQDEEEQERQQIKQQVTDIQKKKADDDAQLGEVQNDVRVIAGRVEGLEHLQKQKEAALRNEIEDLKRQIAQQNEKIKLLDEHMTQSEQKLLAAMQTTLTPPAPPPEKARPEKGEKPEKKDKKSDKKAMSADPFDEAETLFASKDFKKAIVKYEAYREKNPKGTKVPEATYKIGVSFDEIGMRKDAKEFYQEVLDKHGTTKSAKKAKFRLNQMK